VITKLRIGKVVRWTDSRSVRCCTLVAKVGNIEVTICLFTVVAMVTQVRPVQVFLVSVKKVQIIKKFKFEF
jgi:hypothetical protein